MAFLAKQFMSLFLLLIISRLILSTHASRQYFSQSVRATTTAATTATNPTNEKTDELSQDETQPGFYPNKGQQHGLGTPLPRPPYLPWNYNTVKYTTKPSPPNTFQQENEETVAEKYGKYSEQYIEDTKKANQFYFKDNNYGTRNNEKYNNNKVEEEDEEEEEEPLATKEESNNNYNNYNNNKLTNSNSNSKFDEDNQQQYSNTHFYNSKSKRNQEYQPQYKNEWAQTTNTAPVKKQTTFTRTTPEKGTSFYANTDEELDKLLEAEEDDDNSNSNSKLDSAYRSQYTTYTPPYYKKQTTFTQTTTPEKRSRVYANTDDELNKLLEAEDEKPETRSKEQLYGKPQGMSDTRWKENSRFYDVENEKFVDKQSWTEQSLDKYANAFSGNALTYANQNNNP